MARLPPPVNRANQNQVRAALRTNPQPLPTILQTLSSLLSTASSSTSALVRVSPLSLDSLLLSLYSMASHLKHTLNFDLAAFLRNARPNVCPALLKAHLLAVRRSTLDKYIQYTILFLEWFLPQRPNATAHDITGSLIAEYMWELLQRNVKPQTIRLYTNGLQYFFPNTRLPNQQHVIHTTQQALLKHFGVPKNQKWPMTIDLLLRVLRLEPPDTLLKLRNFLVVLFMVAGFLRYSDLAKLTFATTRFTKVTHERERINAIVLFLPWRKNVARDQGDMVLIAVKKRFSLNAIEYLRDYLRMLKHPPKPHRVRAIAQNQDAPLFPSFSTGKPMTRQSIAAIYKHYARLLGLPPEHFSTHSGRIGGVVEAMRLGCKDAYIRHHGSWASTCYLGYANDPVYAHIAVSAALLGARSNPS